MKSSDYEVEGMRSVPDGGEPWMTRLSRPLPPVVARAVGALNTVPGVNRLAAVEVAYTLADAGLLRDIEE